MLKKIRKQPQFDNTLTKLNNTLFRHAFSSVQLFSHGQLLATPWITAHQASLSITNSQSSLRLVSIESVMPSSHQILCHPLLLMPLIPPSIRFFSNESTLRMRWHAYTNGKTIKERQLIINLRVRTVGTWWREGFGWNYDD